MAYIQDSTNPNSGGSENFRSGNNYFGTNNNQQADFALALVIVPEPASLALLGLGSLLMLSRRRA